MTGRTRVVGAGDCDFGGELVEFLHQAVRQSVHGYTMMERARRRTLALFSEDRSDDRDEKVTIFPSRVPVAFAL